MREILFRGKRVDNGEWAYGCLLFDEEQNEVYIAEYFEDKSAYIRTVDSDTVGQYTGLTTKTGKKIFEGDIVKADKFNTPNKCYVIKYDLLLGAFIGKDNGTMYFTTFDGDSELFEIIGNVHDHPELLKGATEDA